VATTTSGFTTSKGAPVFGSSKANPNLKYNPKYNPDPNPNPKTGHTAPVTSMCMVGPDNYRQRVLVSASEDKSVKIWDVRKGSLLRTLLGHTDTVTAVVAVCGWVFSASLDGTIRKWDANPYPAVNMATINIEDGPVKSLASDDSNGILFVGMENGMVLRYDVTGMLLEAAVEAWWGGDGTWYAGVLKGYDKVTKKYKLKYEEDGKVEEVTLPSLEVRLATLGLDKKKGPRGEVYKPGEQMLGRSKKPKPAASAPVPSQQQPPQVDASVGYLPAGVTSLAPQPPVKSKSHGGGGGGAKSRVLGGGTASEAMLEDDPYQDGDKEELSTIKTIVSDPDLPEGWTVEERKRTNAHAKTVKRVDKYYIAPTGKTFRSKLEVMRFLEQGPRILTTLTLTLALTLTLILTLTPIGRLNLST